MASQAPLLLEYHEQDKGRKQDVFSFALNSGGGVPEIRQSQRYSNILNLDIAANLSMSWYSQLFKRLESQYVAPKLTSLLNIFNLDVRLKGASNRPLLVMMLESS